MRKRLIMFCALGGWCCWAGCAKDTQVASEFAAHESQLAIVGDEILGDDGEMDGSMEDIDDADALADAADDETVAGATDAGDVGAADPQAVRPRGPRGLGQLCGGRPRLGPCPRGLVCVTPRTGNPFAGCTAECYGRCELKRPTWPIPLPSRAGQCPSPILRCGGGCCNLGQRCRLEPDGVPACAIFPF
jgi:hypothetical protein